MHRTHENISSSFFDAVTTFTYIMSFPAYCPSVHFTVSNRHAGISPSFLGQLPTQQPNGKLNRRLFTHSNSKPEICNDTLYTESLCRSALLPLTFPLSSDIRCHIAPESKSEPFNADKIVAASVKRALSIVPFTVDSYMTPFSTSISKLNFLLLKGSSFVSTNSHTILNFGVFPKMKLLVCNFEAAPVIPG